MNDLDTRSLLMFSIRYLVMVGLIWGAVVVWFKP